MTAPRLLLPMVVAALVAVTAPAWAADPLIGTKAEQEALKNAENGKLIRAREQAEKILESDPDSVLATYVLAEVFHVEEGNLPRALFLMRKVRKRIETLYGLPPTGELAQQWHRKVIMDLGWLYGEMDRPEDRLAMLDIHDAHYLPPRRDLRMWPLMKLRRFDEARALGRELARSDDIYDRIRGYNGLIATEAEALERQATWDVGNEGIQKTQERPCILWHNTSSSALAVFRFDEAESYAKRALKAPMQDCSNSPYARLAPLYLMQGEFQKAVSALESLRKAGIDKRYREQFEKGNRAALSDLLFVLGQLDQAEQFAREVYEAPDRAGMTSSSQDDIKLGFAIGYAMVLDARMQQELERLAVRGADAQGEVIDRMMDLMLRRWEVGRTAIRQAADGEMLATVVRPYLKAIMPWTAGYLLTTVGEGVVAKAVELARVADAEFEAAQGYYDALDGEMAWRDGDLERAAALGERALKRLPKQAGLVRIRTSGWLADAAWRLGDGARAGKLYAEVLQRVPGTLRQLGIALPVTLPAAGGGWAGRVAERLARSPRLRVTADAGFTVDVYEAGGGKIAACLRDTGGTTYGCAEVEPTGDTEETVVAVADAFHDKALAPKVSLTQSDINSLDGSPVRMDADKVLEGILGPTGPKP